MQPITKKIENLRLKTTLEFHVIGDVKLSLAQKKIEGRIISFKEDKISTSVQNGNVVASLIAPFEIHDINTDEAINIPEIVENFLTENITKIVSV